MRAACTTFSLDSITALARLVVPLVNIMRAQEAASPWGAEAGAGTSPPATWDAQSTRSGSTGRDGAQASYSGPTTAWVTSAA